jgi:hypothetical protein
MNKCIVRLCSVPLNIDVPKEDPQPDKTLLQTTRDLRHKDSKVINTRA